MTVISIHAADHDLEVRRAAAWLAAQGVRHGDLIAAQGVNHPGLLEVAHAALRIGAQIAILAPHLAPQERKDLVERADASVVLSEPQRRPWQSSRPSGDLGPVPLSRPMFATSGTTGRPRLVEPLMLSPDSAAQMHADEAELWRPDPEGTQLVCSPLYHSAGYRSATSMLVAGGVVTLLDRFDAATVLRLLADDPISGAFFVPTHLRRLVSVGGPPIPPARRRLLHAGEPCPPSLARAAGQLLGPLGEFYGSTEGQFTAIGPSERDAHPLSVGRARPGRRIRIEDADPDGIGTVWCETPGFTRFTYRGDTDATDAAWSGDSFTVGDLGWLDGAGYLTLVSRREDLIISGGVNLYPAMIEAALTEDPQILEAVAVGLPDSRWGQSLAVAVVCPAGVDHARRWAAERLVGPSRPKVVEAWETLPRTATGKPSRAEIRRRLGGKG